MESPKDERPELADMLLALGGITPIAYVRPISSDKTAGYAVCASDGTQLAVFPTEDAAFFAAKQHELEPVLVH